MAENLAAVGVCSYNGVTFGAKTETVGFEWRAVYDAAGRTVVYRTYAITLQGPVYCDASGTAYVMGGSGLTGQVSTDALMDAVSLRLGQPGGQLIYVGKGMGTTGRLAINTSARPRDVLWGPKPQLLRLAIKGSNQAIEATWTVEFSIPECDISQYQFAPMEFNWRMAIDIDKSGYSRRTYSGHLRIPQTRINVNSRELTDNADRYLEQALSVVSPPPIGFQRTTNSRIVDESKCRLDFVVTDEELSPNPYPDGIIEATASHTVSSANAKGLSPSTGLWHGAIQASYEVSRDFPKGSAWGCFYALIYDRLVWARNEVREVGGNPGNVFVTGVTFGEPEIYGKKCAAFTCAYLMTCGLNTILTASGLWRPVPGQASFSTWQRSLSNTANHPRGNAKLNLQPSDDVIVDLCITGPQRTSGNQNLPRIPPTPPFLDPTPLQPTNINPRTAWIDYDCWLQLEQDPGIIQHQPLPRARVRLKVSDDPTGESMANSTSGSRSHDAVNLRPPVIIQDAGSTVCAVFLIGWAVRAKYPIPMPNIKTLGGQPCFWADDDTCYWQHKQVANWGQPIYAANWRLRYVLPNVPKKQLEVPFDPTKIDGNPFVSN